MISALWTSTAGLRATQAAIDVVSQNVANAGSAGYVRRTLDTVSSGVGNSGVTVGTVTRSFDAAALKQMRLETAGAAYTATRSQIAGQLDKLYGTPGTATALDGVLNTFTKSLQQLTASPTSAAARSTVLSNAGALAGQINAAATSVQGLRTGIETQLATDTVQANALLSSVASLNSKIQNTSDLTARADLQDQRDQAINGLSGYFDLQTVEQRDGTVSVTTGSGVTLVDRSSAAVLSFDGRGSLSATSSYAANAGQRSVGTLTATTPGGAAIDLGAQGVLRSGSFAAQFELRDQTLPQAQRQLDDFAAGLSRAMTDRTATGTVTGNAATIDLSGLKAGNALTVPVTINGTVRNVVLIASDSATAPVDPSKTDDSNALAQTFDISGTSVDYADRIQKALTALAARSQGGGASLSGLTVSGSGATVTLTGSDAVKVTGASAAITAPATASDLTGSYPRFALFVDGSGNGLITGAQGTGLAQRLSVNTALTANSSALTASSAGGSTATGERAQFAYTALTETARTFSAASGIGGVAAPHSATVVGFASEVIASQGSAAATAQSLDDTQQVALSTAQSRFSSGAGVSIDEEMSKLIALQTAYGANARILTAARDMLNQLLQI